MPTFYTYYEQTRLGEAEPGDVILIEQVDRLTRLDDAGWETLRKQITDKQLAIVSLDLPTSHLALTTVASDDFTRSMLKAVNGMMLDMLAAIARKDYEDRRRRQAEGISKARAEGKYRGRVANAQKHELSSLAAANRSVAKYDTPKSYCSRALLCHIPLNIRTLTQKWSNRPSKP